MPNQQLSSRLLSFQGPSRFRCSWHFRAKTQPVTLMCIEHTAECPVCGKQYLIYVEFCKDYHPPLLQCPRGIRDENEDMIEGRCPSPVCPYSRTGGCCVSWFRGREVLLQRIDFYRPGMTLPGRNQQQSEFLSPDTDLDDLVNSLVLRNFEIILLSNGWRYKTTGMSAFTATFQLAQQNTYRPPMKWRPRKYLTNGLGAVRLIKKSGLNLLPKPDSGGPLSIFQEDGASTEVTGSLVSSKARITAGKGSRTSPEKLKPLLWMSPKPSNDNDNTYRTLHLRCDLLIW